MADKLQVAQELVNRGLVSKLPEEKQAVINELLSRGSLTPATPREFTSGAVPMDLPTPELVDPNTPNSPRGPSFSSVVRDLGKIGAQAASSIGGSAQAVTQPVLDVARGLREEPLSTGGQIIGTALFPASVPLRVLGSSALGTLGSEIEQAIGVSPRSRNLWGNIAINAAETLFGEGAAKIGSKILSKVGDEPIAGTTEKNIVEEFELSGRTATEAEQAIGLDGALLSAERAVKGTGPDESTLDRIIIDSGNKMTKGAMSAVAKRRQVLEDKLTGIVSGKAGVTKDTGQDLATSVASTVQEYVSGKNGLKNTVDALENSTNTLARSDTRIPLSVSKEAVGANYGNLASAFGKNDADLIMDKLARIYQPSAVGAGAKKTDVPASELHQVYLEILDLAQEPSQRAVLFKDPEVTGGTVKGILTQLTDMAEQSGTEFGKSLAQENSIRYGIGRIEGSPVYQALTSGEAKKFDQIFRSPEKYAELQELLGGVVSKDNLDSMLRSRFLSRIEDTSAGIFNSPKFQRAMQDFHPDVVKDALGEEAYDDFLSAMVVNGAVNSRNIYEAAEAYMRTGDLAEARAVMDTAARAFGIAPLASVQGGVAVFAQKLRAGLGIDAKRFNKLSGTEAYNKLKEFSSIRLDDPKAYTLYVNLMREMGTKPLTKEAFQGKLQTPMYEIMGAPKPEEE